MHRWAALAKASVNHPHRRSPRLHSRGEKAPTICLTGLLPFSRVKAEAGNAVCLSIISLARVLMKKRFHNMTVKARKTFSTSTIKYRKFLVAAGMILAVISIVAFLYARRPPKIYYVAYVGRDQNPLFDRLHELAIERYLSELNSELRGVRLQLKRFSNLADKDKYDSREAYRQISEDENFLVVIDNTWGRELKPVAGVIRENYIPVIAINADKGDEDYDHKVVFIGYDDDIPKKVVSFSKLILKNKKVIFITEQSYQLTEKFIGEFNRLGIKTESSTLRVADAKFTDAEKTTLFTELDALLTKKKQDNKTPVIIINTHGDWGVEIIKHIDSENRDVKILGGPYIIDWSKYHKEYGNFGQNDHMNKLIVLTYPSDAVTNRVYNDLLKIKALNPEVSREGEQLFVKRCLDAVAIIRGALIDGRTQLQKSGICRYDLSTFFSDQLAGKQMPTQDDLYTFDADLFLADRRGFEEHSQGDVSSYPKQLDTESTKEIPNIFFGLDNISVSNIDLEHGSFHADFYYWLKFANEHKDVENHIIFRNERNEAKERFVVSEEADRDRTYKLYKRSGEFNFDKNVGKYPFDSQELKIEVDLIHSAEELSISLDPDSLKRSKETKDFLTSEWDGKDIYITVDNLVATSLWGGAKIADKKLQKFGSLNIRIPISRRWISSFVTIILPLFVIGLAAVALLYVRDNSFGNIGEVCVGIFLSIVTYSIAFAQITPRTNILTIADMLFYSTFITVLLIFLKVIFFNSNMISGRVRTWAKDRATLIGHVVLTAYCVLILMILISGLA